MKDKKEIQDYQAFTLNTQFSVLLNTNSNVKLTKFLLFYFINKYEYLFTY